MATKLKKVKSLHELRNLADKDDKYAKLMKVASENLGGPSDTLAGAYDWLVTNATETDEKGVVDEVNFCRDFV